MEAHDQLLSARFSRRTLLKGVGAAGLGVALAQTVLVDGAAAQETVQDILDVTVTVEHFGVTILGAGLDSAMKGNFNPPIPDAVLAVVTAARAQEQFHLDVFKSLGGNAMTTTFTVPDPKLLTDPKAFFGAVQQEETREIAAQIAAFNVFVALKRPDLIKVSFQYAAEEAEHRLLANYAARQ